MPIYRTRLLNLMVRALKNYSGLSSTKVNIYSPGDWPSDPGKGDSLQVGRLINEEKKSMSRGQAEFTTTVYITVDGRIARNLGADALKAIEQLAWKVEQAILTDYYINLNIQQFSTVKTVQEIDSSTGLHVGQFTAEFALEFFQSQEEYYTPTTVTEITSMDINLDLQNIYDPTGTYTGTPVTEEFPNAVVPAPRISGPDGRNEGYTVIELSTE